MPGGGADAMDGAASVQRMARFHARHGTTALLPTSVYRAGRGDPARGAGVAGASHEAGAARVLGLHLEGPFINPEALGAQPPFARSWRTAA